MAAGNAVSYTLARLDDTQQRLLRKIAALLVVPGSPAKLEPRGDDTAQRLTWKIVSLVSASPPALLVPRMDDTIQRLYFKWASLLQITNPTTSLRPRLDDTEQRLLWKIGWLLSTGVPNPKLIPRLDDTAQRLLWKITSLYEAGVTPPAPPAVLPGKAILAAPANGSTGRPLSQTLAWASGGNTVSFNVWFGGVFQGNQIGGTFVPGPLTSLTTYSWRIDSVNAVGVTTGDTWTFETLEVFHFEPVAEVIGWKSAAFPGGTSGNLAAFLADSQSTITEVDLTGTNVTSVTGIGSLTALTRFDCNGCPVLATIEGDSLLTINDLIWRACPALTDASFNGLTTVNYLVGDTCPLLTSVDLSSLVTVSVDFDLSLNTQLGSLDLPDLMSVGGGFFLFLDSLLTSFTAPFLASVGGNLDVGQCLSLPSLPLSALGTVSGDVTANFLNAAVSIDFSQLAVTTTLNLDNNPSVVSIDLSGLVQCPFQNFAVNSSLSGISEPSFNSSIQGFSCTNCGSLSTLSVATANFFAGVGLDASTCPNLSAQALLSPASVFPGGGGGSVNFFGDNLAQSEVDAILANLVAQATPWDGSNTVDLSGGSNSAPTNLIDVSILQGQGVTVTVN